MDAYNEEGWKGYINTSIANAHKEIGFDFGNGQYINPWSSTRMVVGKGAELSDDISETFQFGRYTEVTLDKPMVLSRYYDNVNAFAKGRFMTNSTSTFSFFDRIGLALKPSWNGMT